MGENASVEDFIATLPTKLTFAYPDADGNLRLSSDPADVFSLEPGEYVEAELPVTRHRYRAGNVMLVKPLLDAIEARVAVPGTVEFEVRSLDSYGAEFPPGVPHDSEWERAVDLNDVAGKCVLAVKRASPAWHDACPRASDAAAIADVVARLGGSVALRRSLHPCDGGYGKLADALAAYGLVIGESCIRHEPALAEKRAKARASRARSLSTAGEREEARKVAAKRAAEEELVGVTLRDIRYFAADLADILVTSGVAGMFGYGSVNTYSSPVRLYRRVVDAYDFWYRCGRPEAVYDNLPRTIGEHGADPLKVAQTFVDRVSARRRAALKRAKASGSAKPVDRVGIRYVQACLGVIRELYEDKAARQAAEPAPEQP